MTIRRPLVQPARFSPAPALLVTGLLAEVAIGIAAVVHPPNGNGMSILAIAAVMVIGSVVLVARSVLPQWAKAVAIVALSVLLLALSASQDPFGLRAVRQDLAVTPQEAEAATGPLDDRSLASTASVHASEPGAEAQAAAADLASATNVAAIASDAQVESTLTLAGLPSEPTYELNWSLVRGDVRLWCGRVTVAAPTRAIAFAQMASRMTRALAASKGTTLQCG